MKAFRITGTFKMGMLKNQKFTKEVLADNQNKAKEKIFSELGSKHKSKRSLIVIGKVQEIKPDEIESPLIKGILKQK